MRALALAAVLAIARAAAADPAPSDAAASKQHFKAGEALIKQKRFDDAIKELQTAYDLDPQPLHLYNLGVAHHLRGDDALAVEYYRLFLLDAPPGGTEVRNAISYRAALEKKIGEVRADKIHAELAAEQTKAAQNGEGTVEMLLYAQYTADAEAKEHQISLVNGQIANDDATIIDLEKRAGQLRKETHDTIELSEKWKHHAMTAPSGDGRARRIVGSVFLAVGTAGLSMGLLDKITSVDLPAAKYGDIYLAGGGALFLAGIIVGMNGVGAAKSPRSADTFTHVQVAPSVGPGGGGLSLQAAF